MKMCSLEIIIFKSMIIGSILGRSWRKKYT
uniref:Uncharacterized protein n=1 Tax=Lepeophtheirus salmonis TaxID=72036 RepID=A0A0K2TXK9_LEPSM